MAGSALMSLKVMRSLFRIAARVAPGTAARHAANLFLTPTPRGPTSKWDPSLEPRVSIVEFQGDLLRVFRFGPLDASKRVLLCHGWRGCASQLSAFVSPLVNGGYEVVAFDGPAHGASQRRQTSIVEFSRLVRQLDTMVGGFDAAIGHSFGSSALIVALRDGLRATKVVLVAPVSALDQTFTRFAGTLRLSPTMQKGVRRELTQRLGAQLNGWVLADWVPQFQAQALVVHDERDRQVPLSEGQRIVQAWPGATLHRTHGLGHNRILRNAAVVAAVREFLAPVAVC